MGVRTAVRPRMALSISMYVLKHGRPPADGVQYGHAWLYSEDSEDSEEEDNFSDDAPPSKKLCRRLEEQTSRDSESE